MFVSLLFATALMMQANNDAPAPAGPATPVAQPAATPDKVKKTSNPDAMICKNEPVLGSKMPQRVCYNKAQMAEKSADDRAELLKEQYQIQLPHNF